MYTVLLVDDEPLAIEGLQMFVDWEKHGFRICGVCENGAEALSVAQELMPDVIVTDILMPQMDGLELIGHLQGARGEFTKFVVISAYSEFSFAKRAMQLGVCNYLLKPIMKEEADEVLSQIRMRLDHERLNWKKGGGNEETMLPVMAVKQMKEVLQAIEDSDGGRVSKEIDSLFQMMSNHPLEWCQLFMDSLTVQCSKLIREYGGDPVLLLIPNSDLSQKKYNELESIRVRIDSYIEQAMRALQSLRKHRPGNTLTEIDRYVYEHYRSPISVKDVAARFYLNPVYLGRAYQDRFGCSLIDRMHDLRISEACEKLRDTNDPIYSIAEQVGYAHYHYFLRQFEQRTGMKPVEYRLSRD